MKYWFVSMMSLAMSLALHAGGVRSGKAQAELLLQDKSVAAGGDTLLALRLTPDKGWHSYWKNPGDMGMATSVEWILPEGVTVGALQYPAPHVFESSGIKSLGYEGEVVLLAKLSVSEDAKPGKVTVKGKSSWLTCTAEACIPGDADLQLSFDIADKSAKSESADTAGLIQQAAGKLPLTVEWKSTAKLEDKKLKISVVLPDEAALKTEGLHLYVAEQSIIEVGQDVKWSKNGSELTAELKLSEYFSKLPVNLELTLTGGGMERDVTFLSQTQK